MKKGYLAGFLSGIGITLVAAIATITITGGVNQLFSDGSGIGRSGIQIYTGNYTDDQISILKKVVFLEKMVDTYYLDEVDKDVMATGVYRGLIESLGDPYSTYYSPEEYQALRESSSGTYCGIGATVSQNIKTGVITIVKPFVDGPAYRAGTLPGDILYKVDGEEVTGKDITDVVRRMKGQEGTKVVIEVLRESEEKEISFTITRAFIHIPTVEHRMLEDNIGYILVSEFDEVTVHQFEDAIKDLKQQGMESLIIDLRDNPGGLLNSVVDVLGQILDKGMFVYTEDKYGKRDEWKDEDQAKLDLPLCVLINGQSASASEIFAGAVQDYGVGTLVGTTTFGKGIVQSVRPLKDGSAVKLTTSKYFTPNGRNIHGTGIEPDVEVELDDELKTKVVISPEEDNQLQEAIKMIKDKMAKIQ